MTAMTSARHFTVWPSVICFTIAILSIVHPSGATYPPNNVQHNPLRAIEDESRKGMMNAINVQKPRIAKSFGHALDPARGSVVHVFDTIEGVGQLGLAGVAGVQGAVEGAGQGIRRQIYIWARNNQGMRMYRRGILNDAVQRAKYCGKECARGAGAELGKAQKKKAEAESAGYAMDNALMKQDMASAEAEMRHMKTAQRESWSHLTSVPMTAISRGTRALFSPTSKFSKRPKSPEATTATPSSVSTRRASGLPQTVWLVVRSDKEDEAPLLRKRAPPAGEVGSAVSKAFRSKSVGALPRAFKAAEHVGAANSAKPAAAGLKSSPKMSHDAKVSFAASAAAVGAAIASNIHISTPPISLHVQGRPNGRGRGFHTQLGEGGVSGSLGSAQFHVPTSPRSFGRGGGPY